MDPNPLPYDLWLTESLKLVAKRALEHAASHGLPGGHHFYLTFRTDAPGVEMPGQLRARYPQDITIVLQHQFWDLEVDDAGFGVTLSFQGRSSRLRVPFAAVTAFADPSVKFGLQFKLPEGTESTTDREAAPSAEGAGDKPAAGDPRGEVISLDTFRRKP